MKGIYQVIFPITPYGEVEETAKWAEPVSQATAIAAVERYLSRPTTEHYFETLKARAYLPLTWNEARQECPRRADLLGGHVFLEKAPVENGEMVLILGS